MRIRTQVFQRRIASSLLARADRLGLLVALQRLLEKVIGHEARVRPAVAKHGARAPFADDAAVVGPLVLAVEAREDFLGATDVDGRPFELVGQGEQQRDEGLLVVRLDLQDVQTDALGLPRLVQEPVALRLLERPRNGFPRQRLELGHDFLPRA